MPVNARCAVLDLIGLDLVNLELECPVDHAAVVAGDVCPACGFDPAVDCEPGSYRDGSDEPHQR